MYEELRKNLVNAVKLYSYYIQIKNTSYVKSETDKKVEQLVNDLEEKIFKI